MLMVLETLTFSWLYIIGIFILGISLNEHSFKNMFYLITLINDRL